jgi:FkbM family methyltransferase
VLKVIGLYSKDADSIIRANKSYLEWLYDYLDDADSKEILLKVLAYRILGHRRVKLPLNTDLYWKRLSELDERAADAEAIEIGINGWKLSKLNLEPEGYHIELFTRPTGVFVQFLMQQYRCQLDDSAIEVKQGDTVIDCGGCFGDTALYFAHKSGQSGCVYSFEFMPENLIIFQRNMRLNKDLAERIQLMGKPLWSSSGLKLFIEGSGPGTHLTPRPKDSSAKEVKTFSIDDLMQEKKLRRVDFIKMDIEGAELEALKGAKNTLLRFKPKLAISVYHNLHDFWTIPQWLDSLDLGYHFYLRHFTIHSEETVLFAKVNRI